MAFLERTHGGAGFIGQRYVHVWRAEDLVEVNRAYKIAEFFPHFFLIGSDGGEEAYACDVSENEPTVFEVPMANVKCRKSGCLGSA